jgi:hypothetical protein
LNGFLDDIIGMSLKMGVNVDLMTRLSPLTGHLLFFVLRIVRIRMLRSKVIATQHFFHVPVNPEARATPISSPTQRLGSTVEPPFPPKSLNDEDRAAVDDLSFQLMRRTEFQKTRRLLTVKSRKKYLGRITLSDL